MLAGAPDLATLWTMLGSGEAGVVWLYLDWQEIAQASGAARGYQ